MITKVNGSKVRCGDIYDDLTELFGNDHVDIFYSDPPWGEGNLRYWQTMNKKMNGVEAKDVDLNKFLNRLMECCKTYTKDTGIIFIEYGVKWNDSLIELAKNYDLRCVKTIELLYGSPKRVNLLNIFVKGNMNIDIPKGYEESVYHKSGLQVLESSITPFLKGGDIICDLCCGLGFTAQYAINHDLKFIGNELNQARLDKTIERLKRNKYSRN